MLARPKRGEQWEKVGNWTQGARRGRVSGVLSATLPLLAPKDPLNEVIVYPERELIVTGRREYTEEDVQSGLDPIAVLVLPSGHLPAEHVTRLVHCGAEGGEGETRPAGQSLAGGGNTPRGGGESGTPP
eukprot:4472334-Pyramimonas_sp.AAC.1